MMMLGYIHKDQSLPHFRVVLHNINPNEIIKGIAEWQTAKLSYEDNKIMLTKANLFHRLSTYRMNSDPESNNSFVHDMTNLLNTKKYMVATQFVLQSGALRVVAAESMYKLVKGVEPMTSTDTTDLFFQPGFAPYRPGAAVPGQRFFDSEPEPVTQPEPATPLRATDGCLANDNPQGPSPRASVETLSPFVRRMMSTAATPPTRNALGSSSADDTSRPIRPDSPVSDDSGEHDSDAEFINDEIEDSNPDSDNSDDGDTCRPVRANNGKGVAS